MPASGSGTWSRDSPESPFDRVIPVEDVLEALDLSRAQPGSGFLEALRARFNARVPFENASKIVRDRDVAIFDEKPRPPDHFWSEHLARGTGGTCFERVAAFDALLSALGFRTRKLLGKVERDDDHAALLVSTASGDTLVDVGFPLPANVPLRSGRIETALTDMDVTETPRGLRIVFSGGIPEGPGELEVFLDEVSEERFRGSWRETFRPGSRFLRALTLRTDAGHRAISFAQGALRIDDRHSRLILPLTDERAARLSDVFGVDADILREALAIAGDPPPAQAESLLTAYLETERDARSAYAAIATPEGYRRLLEGVADVVEEEKTPSGFRFELAAPGSEGAPQSRLSEEVVAEEGALRLSILRRAGSREARSSYRAVRRGGRTWLLRETALPALREDLLRNDALRGRFAGTLAVDLLAWARKISEPLR